MNARTAKDILGLSISRKMHVGSKKEVQPKTAVQRILFSSKSKSRDTNGQKYFEQKKQIEIRQPSIEAHVVPSIESQILSKDSQSSEASHRQIKSVPRYRFSHRQFHPEDHHSNICDEKCASLNRKNKSTQVPKSRLAKNNILNLHSQVVETKPSQQNKYHSHILRKTVKTINHQDKKSNESISISDKKEQNYYITDVKKSVHEFMNNREYADPHLNHFIDSIAAFEQHLHTLPPKEILIKPIELPHQEQRITIIFDLDETLVHTQPVNWNATSEEIQDGGRVIEVCTENGDYRINIKARPHAVEVLTRLRQKFELGVFTASQEAYGSKIVQELDPQNTLFSFKLYRQHCLELNSRNNHIKDLRILKNRDLSKLILVDNSPQTYLFQKSNAIPIIPFTNDPQDSEMLKLERFLESLSAVSDVRPFLRDYFKLDQYHNFKNMFRLVKQLY